MKLAYVILAAGQSKRFNGCKLLAKTQGKALLQHALDKAVTLRPDDTYVVTGAWHLELQQAIKQRQLTEFNAIYNPDWSSGMGSGISLATKRLETEYDYLLFVLADQLALQVADVQLLVDKTQPDAVVAASYNNTLGVPAIFPRFSYSELKQLDGQTGARALLREQQLTVQSVDLPAAALDIDFLADLEQ